MINKQRLTIAIITSLFAGILLLPAGGQDKAEGTFHAKGYLVDIACAAVHSTQGDGSWGVTHNRRCLQSESSAKAGFALLLPNGKIYRFDAAGNELARKAIASTKKDHDFRVEVSGDLADADLRVKSLLLLK